VKPEGDGPTVFADRQACVETLRQLLVNADRFSSGQAIVLGAEPVSIRPEQGGDASESGMRERVSSATQLYVRDKGVGISREELPYVFDKFYRGERAASAFPGTGLGLAMVRTLVNQNDGRVWADSAPGRGSTFYVLLPSHAPGNHH
jgi:signal transduction histidine kinase